MEIINSSFRCSSLSWVVASRNDLSLEIRDNRTISECRKQRQWKEESVNWIWPWVMIWIIWNKNSSRNFRCYIDWLANKFVVVVIVFVVDVMYECLSLLLLHLVCVTKGNNLRSDNGQMMFSLKIINQFNVVD